MSNVRKKHDHPPLTPPRTLWRRWVDKGLYLKEKITAQKNDEAKVIENRIFTYHPTKGWRNRRFA